MLKVVVVFGANTVKVCTTLSGLTDKIKLEPFTRLGELFNEYEIVEPDFQRIVVTASMMRVGNLESNIDRLNALLNRADKSVSVVFVCKTGEDVTLTERLLSTFTRDNVLIADMISSSTNSALDLCQASFDVLEKYRYVSPYGKMDIVDKNSISDVSIDEDLTEEKPNEGIQSDIEQTPQVVATNKKKKSGFFLNSILRIKPSEEETSEDSTDEDVSEVQGFDSNIDDGTVVDEDDDVTAVELDDDFTEDSDVIIEKIEDDFQEDFSDDLSGSSISEVDEVVKDYPTTQSPVVINNVKPVNTQISQAVPTETVEVDDDGDLLNLGMQSDYLNNTAQVKVVEKVVEKRVEVYQGKLVSPLDVLRTGVVVVTGDRRTGVTSLAWNLANTLVDHGKRVLYIDGDTSRRGVLLKLDYREFKKYSRATTHCMALSEDISQLCSNAFPVNKSLRVVTADYGVVVPQSELSLILDLVSIGVRDFDIIIVDLPIDNLVCIENMVSVSKVIVTANADVGCVLGTLIGAESSCLRERSKNLLIARGTLALYTPVEVKPRNVLSLVNSLVTFDVPWLDMKVVDYNTLNEEILGRFLEV